MPTSFESPTIVLVHRPLTDASVWKKVMAQLQSDGRTVLAPATPIRQAASVGSLAIH